MNARHAKARICWCLGKILRTGATWPEAAFVGVDLDGPDGRRLEEAVSELAGEMERRGEAATHIGLGRVQDDQFSEHPEGT